MEPVVEFKDFSWKYKSSKDRVLKSIDLKIYKGDYLGIMGPTGAGKSTLCACMNGLIPLKTRGFISGHVEIFGVNTRTLKMPEITARVGLIFQDPETQFIMMNVEDEIVLGLETLGLEREEIKNRIEWALNIVGLKGFELRSPEELSGGQKQRVAIASILAMRPEILILDEPTSDLDPLGKMEVFELLDKIKKEFDLTIVLVSHETRKILEFCNRVIIIDDGEKKYDGPTPDLLNNTELLKNSGIYIPEDVCEKRLAEAKAIIKRDEKPIIEVSNISFTYPDMTQALKDVSLKFFKGDFIAIIGKNGSGKTTLVKHFNGLLKPQQGQIQLYDKIISEYSIPQIAQIVGYCYQNPDHQLFKSTIKEEIEFGLKNLKFPHKEIEERYDEIVELLQLKKFEEVYESTLYLSKGIRQRLALASVLVLKPEILIVDEPSTGQDFLMINEFMNILEDLNNENKTIIIITHNPYIIAKYAKEVVILDDGKLIEKLPTEEFLKNDRFQKLACFIPP
ncbi:MAG: ABC transporter ATP-binding protein [Candidatus Thorarchaeota archaeon]